MTDKKEVGMKFDGEKERWDLLPMDALNEVAKVLTFGAKKYKAWNWEHVDDAENRYYAAAERHLRDIQNAKRGLEGASEFDSESNLLHAAHAACCCLFVASLALQRKQKEKEIENQKDPIFVPHFDFELMKYGETNLNKSVCAEEAIKKAATQFNKFCAEIIVDQDGNLVGTKQLKNEDFKKISSSTKKHWHNAITKYFTRKKEDANN